MVKANDASIVKVGSVLVQNGREYKITKMEDIQDRGIYIELDDDSSVLYALGTFKHDVYIK